MAAVIENPIINTPYHEPAKHWVLDERGQPTSELAAGRRPSETWMPVPRARKGRKTAAGVQHELFFDGILEERKGQDVIGNIRNEVRRWREAEYPNVTPTTRRLLEYWTDPVRERKFFFAQVEAVETAIYLTEVGTKLGKPWMTTHLEEANAEHSAGLPRVALKMATGSGKTVVMAMLIAWHTLNKVASPQDKRFAKRFLLVAPGITIRDRLRVLLPSDPNNYYTERDVVPADLWGALGQAQVTITNYHAFMLKTTREGQGLASKTKKLLLARAKQDPFIETPDMMVNRVLRDLGGSKGEIIVINDEAHHCYQTRGAALEGAVTVDELKGDEKKQAAEENEHARRWFDGLNHIMRKTGIKTVYDLSATPFYLNGSGYPEGTLFPWVVSDFGLLDAIESGLVKIPRVPVDDDAENKDVSYLNLWAQIKDRMPKRSQKPETLADQSLPGVLDGAAHSLYRNYAKAFARWEAETQGTGSTPPVFIVVCNNTTVSKWVYDQMAGHEIPDSDGVGKPGMLKLFSNYDEKGGRYAVPRTILVDSTQLESDNPQLSSEFKAAATEELEAFKEEYRIRFPDRDVEALTDADLLREVLNTVGKKGKLGQDVRCVVSVSMLTEGWDANTVTHVLGVRAFGSHLLCEQVVGRGLRRISYAVNDGGLLEPEYADVYGIPFQFIQTDPNRELRTKPRPDPKHVRAMKDREDLRITFPRLEGYRVEVEEAQFYADFEQAEPFKVPEDVATLTQVQGLVGEDVRHTLTDGRNVRIQQVAFQLAGLALQRLKDPTHAPKPWMFPNLVALAKEWLARCVGEDQRALSIINQVAEVRENAANQFFSSLNRQEGNNSSKVLPIFARYAPEGSTDDVDFFTTKSVYEAEPDKSPVNYVVLDGIDGNTWEQILATLLDGNKHVDSYVKNDHLEFVIPYLYAGRTHRYLPDFIVRLKPRDEEDEVRHLIVEVSGSRKSAGMRAMKAETARMWCAAVNNHGGFGRWGYIELSEDPTRFKAGLNAAIEALYGDGPLTGLHEDALRSEGVDWGSDDYDWDDLFSAAREAEAEQRQQHSTGDEEGK
ncbi:type III restriction enzyme [Streptomyces aurantiacus]|uniref:BPTD_3080 family restriction endonuclease n=1 Tax=Streptomyces aurantiacus TaxID=47760 RepID=UPI002790169E|nr:DEAD/DEAH box helicase family protein [Streptomyces aurantiacus]MDQ0778389.1 type III restriction enzyme [Streptomyces aurantiacus]